MMTINWAVKSLGWEWSSMILKIIDPGYKCFLKVSNEVLFANTQSASSIYISWCLNSDTMYQTTNSQPWSILCPIKANQIYMQGGHSLAMLLVLSNEVCSGWVANHQHCSHAVMTICVTPFLMELWFIGCSGMHSVEAWGVNGTQ